MMDQPSALPCFLGTLWKI